jgi:hypothetical protein
VELQVSTTLQQQCIIVQAFIGKPVCIACFEVKKHDVSPAGFVFILLSEQIVIVFTLYITNQIIFLSGDAVCVLGCKTQF